MQKFLNFSDLRVDNRQPILIFNNREVKKISPRYDMENVYNAIRQGNYQVYSHVWTDIKHDFGWGVKNLEKFFLSLKPKHFDKQMERKRPPRNDYSGEIPVILDVYKSDDIMGEKIYSHFYFDGNELIIDSIHEQD